MKLFWKAWHAWRQWQYSLWAIRATVGLVAGVGGIAGMILGREHVNLMRDSPELASNDTFETGSTQTPAWDQVPWTRVWWIMGAVAMLAVLRVLYTWPMPDPGNDWPDGRDPKRLFGDADFAWIRRCANNRCEHRYCFGLLRCTRSIAHDLQRDHWYPHAKGGATVRGNEVGLCSRCNNRKSDRIPSRFETWALRRARRSYFPPDELETGLDLTGRRA